MPHLRFRRHGMAGFMASCPASLSVDRTYVAIEPRIVGVLGAWQRGPPRSLRVFNIHRYLRISYSLSVVSITISRDGRTYITLTPLQVKVVKVLAILAAPQHIVILPHPPHSSVGRCGGCTFPMPQQQAANLQEWFWWHSYSTSLCWLTETEMILMMIMMTPLLCCCWGSWGHEPS